MRVIPIFFMLVAFMTISSKVEAQNRDLKKMTDEQWIEYWVPRFVKDKTPYGDHFTPHYTEFNFESIDKLVTINVTINNSTNSRFRYNLKQHYFDGIKRSDLNVKYKLLKSNKYFLSGNLRNGDILYEFAQTQSGYGYTYSIIYDARYQPFFQKNLNDIIKGFKILY